MQQVANFQKPSLPPHTFEKKMPGYEIHYALKQSCEIHGHGSGSRP